MDHYGHFGWFSFLILPQIKWLNTLLKCHNVRFLFFQIKIQIIMIDYVKKKFDFVQRQNSYRASKLTFKKYFSGIKAGISPSQPVKQKVMLRPKSRVVLPRPIWMVNYYVKSFSNNLSNENIKTGVSRKMILQKQFTLAF